MTNNIMGKNRILALLLCLLACVSASGCEYTYHIIVDNRTRMDVSAVTNLSSNGMLVLACTVLLSDRLNGPGGLGVLSVTIDHYNNGQRTLTYWPIVKYADKPIYIILDDKETSYCPEEIINKYIITINNKSADDTYIYYRGKIYKINARSSQQIGLFNGDIVDVFGNIKGSRKPDLPVKKWDTIINFSIGYHIGDIPNIVITAND